MPWSFVPWVTSANRMRPSFAHWMASRSLVAASCVWHGVWICDCERPTKLALNHRRCRPTLAPVISPRRPSCQIGMVTGGDSSPSYCASARASARRFRPAGVVGGGPRKTGTFSSSAQAAIASCWTWDGSLLDCRSLNCHVVCTRSGSSHKGPYTSLMPYHHMFFQGAGSLVASWAASMAHSAFIRRSTCRWETPPSL